MRIRKALGVFALVLGLVAWPIGTQAAARTAQITVNATPTVIWTAPSGSGKVLVRNPSATVSVFVGNATVSTSNGFEIAPGAALGIVLMNGAQLFGIVSAGSQVVQTIQGDNIS